MFVYSFLKSHDACQRLREVRWSHDYNLYFLKFLPTDVFNKELQFDTKEQKMLAHSNKKATLRMDFYPKVQIKMNLTTPISFHFILFYFTF